MTANQPLPAHTIPFWVVSGATILHYQQISARFKNSQSPTPYNEALASLKKMSHLSEKPASALSRMADFSFAIP